MTAIALNSALPLVDLSELTSAFHKAAQTLLVRTSRFVAGATAAITTHTVMEKPAEMLVLGALKFLGVSASIITPYMAPIVLVGAYAAHKALETAVELGQEAYRKIEEAKREAHRNMLIAFAGISLALTEPTATLTVKAQEEVADLKKAGFQLTAVNDDYVTDAIELNPEPASVTAPGYGIRKTSFTSKLEI